MSRFLYLFSVAIRLSKSRITSTLYVINCNIQLAVRCRKPTILTARRSLYMIVRIIVRVSKLISLKKNVFP